MSEVKITAKQEAFCREYLIDLNATQAAIRAGYSEKTAAEQSSRLLTNVKVSDFIALLKAERNESLRIDAAWVLKQAVKVHLRCMQAELVKDREGNPVGEYKFEHAGANKALEIIGKHVDVKAFDGEQKGNADSLADSVSKLIDKLPN